MFGFVDRTIVHVMYEQIILHSLALHMRNTSRFYVSHLRIVWHCTRGVLFKKTLVAYLEVVHKTF
jgi:hypothetical protein